MILDWIDFADIESARNTLIKKDHIIDEKAVEVKKTKPKELIENHHPAGVFSKKKSTPINDIEGWHNALERRAAGKRNLQFYPMIILLHKEARLTSPDDEQSPI